MRLYLHKTYFSPFFFALLLHVLNRVNGLFHLGYSDFITQVDINKCEASVCFTFPTAVCMFRSGERTFRSGECTFRNAEHRIKACYDKITIALVSTLPQLLSYVALPGLNGAYASIYATAHDTPKAVPIAANTAEARFHRNLISLDLFSFVILKKHLLS